MPAVSRVPPATAGAGFLVCGGQVTFEPLNQGPVSKLDLLGGRQRARHGRQAADLMTGLANPACVDMAGAQYPPPCSPPTGKCPVGTTRAFPHDMHVGLLSSSLGSFGADGART